MVFPQIHLRGLHPAKGEFSTRTQEKQIKKTEYRIQETGACPPPAGQNGGHQEIRASGSPAALPDQEIRGREAARRGPGNQGIRGWIPGNQGIRVRGREIATAVRPRNDSVNQRSSAVRFLDRRQETLLFAIHSTPLRTSFRFAPSKKGRIFDPSKKSRMCQIWD